MRIACPTCRQVLDLSGRAAGLVVNCPACGAAVQVPPGAAVTLMPAAPSAPQMPQMPPPIPYPQGAQPVGENAAMRMLLPVGRSVLAIIAGYLGLFSILLLPAPIAVLISILAILHLKKHPEKHGRGRAIFGLVMGLAGMAVLAWLFITLAVGH